MVIFKINVNACILTHPTNNYIFWGEIILKYPISYILLVLFLIPQVTNVFDFTPKKFSEPNCCPFFSYTAFCFLEPNFFE